MALAGIQHKEQKPNFRGVEVIGVGLPRTGTYSLRSALNILLDGAIYHLFDTRSGINVDLTFWEAAVNAGIGNGTGSPRKSNKWKDFLEGRGFRGGVNYPLALFYKELMQAFPKAKFVLTIRNPEAWYQSVKRSTYTLYRKTPTNMVLWFGSRQNHMKTVNALFHKAPEGFDQGLFQAIEAGPEAAIGFYNKWVDEVKKTIPEERLLIFNVSDGWAPLAEFLNKPMPKVAFPKENTISASSKLVRNSRFNACFYALMLILPPILAIIAFFLPEETFTKFCDSTMAFVKQLPDLTMKFCDNAMTFMKGIPDYSLEVFEQMRVKYLETQHSNKN